MVGLKVKPYILHFVRSQRQVGLKAKPYIGALG